MGELVLMEELKQERKYLVFDIGIEKFGIEGDKIKEVALCQEAVAMPGQPSVIEGFIRFRGGIVPVLNLRKNFSLPAAVLTDKTRILLVEIQGIDLGIIVDRVLDEVTIATHAIKEVASAFSMSLQKKYINGLADTEIGIIQLINLDEVVKEL